MKQWNELTYKEKFIRTLIFTPFCILACVIVWYGFRHKAQAVIAITVIAVVLVWQLIYTYTKWKNGE